MFEHLFFFFSIANFNIQVFPHPKLGFYFGVAKYFLVLNLDLFLEFLIGWVFSRP